MIELQSVIFSTFVFNMLCTVLLSAFSGYSRLWVCSEGTAETATETLQQTDSRRGHVDTGGRSVLEQA